MFCLIAKGNDQGEMGGVVTRLRNAVCLLPAHNHAQQPNCIENIDESDGEEQNYHSFTASKKGAIEQRAHHFGN